MGYWIIHDDEPVDETTTLSLYCKAKVESHSDNVLCFSMLDVRLCSSGTDTCNTHTEIFQVYCFYCCIDVFYEYDIILIVIVMIRILIWMIWLFRIHYDVLWCWLRYLELLNRNTDDILILRYVELTVRYIELLNYWWDLRSSEWLNWHRDVYYRWDYSGKLILTFSFKRCRDAYNVTTFEINWNIDVNVNSIWCDDLLARWCWVYLMSWYSDVAIPRIVDAYNYNDNILDVYNWLLEVMLRLFEFIWVFRFRIQYCISNLFFPFGAVSC